jgi:hypothetical protein
LQYLVERLLQHQEKGTEADKAHHGMNIVQKIIILQPQRNMRPKLPAYIYY